MFTTTSSFVPLALIVGAGGIAFSDAGDAGDANSKIDPGAMATSYLQLVDTMPRSSRDFAEGADKLAAKTREFGLRSVSLQPGRLQPASGVQSGARGLTPEAEWRAMFPKKIQQ